MKRKTCKLCAEFGCRRAVLFPQAARTNPSMRYCKKHTPARMMAQRRNLKPAAQNSEKNSQPFDPVPLVCFYKPYELASGDRVVFAAKICGRPAPRRALGDRSLPKYPNRFNEPLCKAHAHLANDERAFPGETPEVPAWPNEKVEVNERANALIGQRATSVANQKELLQLDVSLFSPGHAVRVDSLHAYAQIGADQQWRKLPKWWPWTATLRGKALAEAEVLGQSRTRVMSEGKGKVVKYTKVQKWLPAYAGFRTAEKVHARVEGVRTVCGIEFGNVVDVPGHPPKRGTPESKIFVWRKLTAKWVNCATCWNRLFETGIVEPEAKAYDVAKLGRSEFFCAIPHRLLTFNPLHLPPGVQRSACGLRVVENTSLVVRNQNPTQPVVKITCRACTKALNRAKREERLSRASSGVRRPAGSSKVIQRFERRILSNVRVGLAAAFNMRASDVRVANAISRLLAKGWLERLGAGPLQITDLGRASLGLGGSPIPKAGPMPTRKRAERKRQRGIKQHLPIWERKKKEQEEKRLAVANALKHQGTTESNTEVQETK